MSAAALLAKNKNPTDTEIDEAMSGNLCRCGTYERSGEPSTERGRIRSMSEVVKLSRRRFLQLSTAGGTALVLG